MASHDDPTLGFGTRVIMTHASVPTETRDKLGIADGFIRLSVGDLEFHAAKA